MQHIFHDRNLLDTTCLEEFLWLVAKTNFRIYRFPKHNISLELDKFGFAWDIKIKDFKVYILGFPTGHENFQKHFLSQIYSIDIFSYFVFDWKS